MFIILILIVMLKYHIIYVHLTMTLKFFKMNVVMKLTQIYFNVRKNIAISSLIFTLLIT